MGHCGVFVVGVIVRIEGGMKRFPEVRDGGFNKVEGQDMCSPLRGRTGVISGSKARGIEEVLVESGPPCGSL